MNYGRKATWAARRRPKIQLRLARRRLVPTKRPVRLALPPARRRATWTRPTRRGGGRPPPRVPQPEAPEPVEAQAQDPEPEPVEPGPAPEPKPAAAEAAKGDAGDEEAARNERLDALQARAADAAERAQAERAEEEAGAQDYADRQASRAEAGIDPEPDDVGGWQASVPVAEEEMEPG
jgi:hypothetical protein